MSTQEQTRRTGYEMERARWRRLREWAYVVGGSRLWQDFPSIADDPQGSAPLTYEQMRVGIAEQEMTARLGPVARWIGVDVTHQPGGESTLPKPTAHETGAEQ